jgi:hypothetical protein
MGSCWFNADYNAPGALWHQRLLDGRARFALHWRPWTSGHSSPPAQRMPADGVSLNAADGVNIASPPGAAWSGCNSRTQVPHAVDDR